MGDAGPPQSHKTTRHLSARDSFLELSTSQVALENVKYLEPLDQSHPFIKKRVILAILKLEKVELIVGD